MTPRYEWTPASEPPDTDRDVLVWRRNECEFGKCDYGVWRIWSRPWIVYDITHWRDIEPPKESAE